MQEDLARRAAALRRWRDELLIALALAALACALALGGWTWRLDMVVYDLGLAQFRRPAPPGIVIIAIDERSLRRIGRWPWSRAVHATLFKQLAELPQRPRAIGFDVVLSESDDDSPNDSLLAEAMKRGAPVVLPMHWRGSTLKNVQAVEPTETLRAVSRMGAISERADDDGVLRTSFLRTSAANQPQQRYPSFALAVLDAGGETPHPRAQALADQDHSTAEIPSGGGIRHAGHYAVRYTGPRDTIEQLSYVDVLAGQVPPAKLAGRYVLIGMTAEGMGDTVATPVNNIHLSMPGIEVHANSLYTLRSGDGIELVPAARVAAFSVAALALLLLAFNRFGPRVALPLAVASLPLALAASLLALDAGLWFSPVPYAVAAALAYPLWSWRRLERAVARLDLEIADLVQMGPLRVATSTDLAPRARRTDGDALEARLHALRRAGLLMRETQRFFADALAAMPTAMLVADRGARVVLANPRAAALFEVDSDEELLGLDLARLLGEFTPTGSSIDWAQALAALRPGAEAISVEVTQGDSERPPAERGAYVVSVALVDLHGLERLIVTVSDVATVKQAQRDREEVLAFVSHDLRSPASAIVLLADLHLQGRVQTPLPELMTEVRQLASRTLALSEGLVRAAQAQTQPLQRERVRLGALLDEALAELRPRARAAEIELICELAHPDLGLHVDRLLLGRAIGNVVGNALRHAPPGSAVELGTSLRNGHLVLTVRDHGPGLSAKQLEQLARGDEGVAVADARGVGLGLLFVQRVARRHGGELRASAPPGGRGACFEIDLPV